MTPKKTYLPPKTKTENNQQVSPANLKKVEQALITSQTKLLVPEIQVEPTESFQPTSNIGHAPTPNNSMAEEDSNSKSGDLSDGLSVTRSSRAGSFFDAWGNRFVNYPYLSKI